MTPVTFNVVFTPGSVRPLLPFAVSLLRGSGVRVRLVGNGCIASERELLASASALDPRLLHHDLPFSDVVDHGRALNELFISFNDRFFAIADSDVVASGDFIGRLLPLGPAQAAVFAAPPVWMTDASGAAPRATALSSGRHRVLPDGTPVGGTSLAIYARTALEPAWRKAPRGFAVQRGSRLPRPLRESLSERGWLYGTFDTGRLINLVLLGSGFSLENRAAPQLHHVGGLSSEAHAGLRAQLAGLRSLARSNEPLLVSLVDRAAARIGRAREDRRAGRSAVNERRRQVLAHVDAVIEALLHGEPRPAAPPTGSTEVDERLTALVAALEALYEPRGDDRSSTLARRVVELVRSAGFSRSAG